MRFVSGIRVPDIRKAKNLILEESTNSGMSEEVIDLFMSSSNGRILKVNEPTPTEKLLFNMIDRIPNLRNTQSARSYLKIVQKIPEDKINREPDKVWKEVNGRMV